jgi:putative membrane protein (TIGR04086 family)
VNRSGSIDRIVVGRGAAFGLLLGAPAAVVNVLLADQDPKPKTALNATLLALLVAFWISGYVAGREAADRRPLHGVLAGLTTFALVEAIGLLGRLDRGDDINPAQVAVLGAVAVALATSGAGVGARRPANPSPEPGGSP